MMSPCKDCTKRCALCHDNCAEYKTYTERREELDDGWWSSKQATRFARTDKRANGCGLRSYR